MAVCPVLANSLWFRPEFKRGRSFPLLFTAFGIPISIRTNAAELISRLLQHLPPGSKPTSAAPKRSYMLRLEGSRGHLTTCTGARSRGAEIVDVSVMRVTRGRLGVGLATLLRTPCLAEALQALESDIQIHVAKFCKERLFVHAGVVGWRDHAIVIPGLSGTGKTSLVVSLLKAGAIYYSDEYAAFDRDGRVHPYARPLRIRSGREKLRVGYPPETLGAVRGIESLPLGLVVVTQYCAGGEWRPRVLSPGRALLALLANTVSVRRQPDFALATLRRATANALAIESCRGEADRVPAFLFKQLEDHVAHVGGLTEL